MKRKLSIFLIITIVLFPMQTIDANIQQSSLNNEVVLFIPGFLASEIYEVIPPTYYNPFPRHDKIWPSINSSTKRRLIQDENGIPVNETIVGNVIERYALPFYVAHYQTEIMLNYLRNNGVTVITVPFDWRIDLASEDTSDRISLAIEDALAESNGSQITIISHSTGGIVARNFLIQNRDVAANIKSFINIGSPNLGSVQAMQALTEGMSMGFLTFGLTPKDSRFISQNMTSIYQLLPGEEYVNIYKGLYNNNFSTFYADHTKAVINTDIGVVNNYIKTDAYLQRYHNRNLYNSSKAFRNRIENQSLPAHIQEYRVIGYNRNTILSIMKYDEKKNPKIPSLTDTVEKYRPLWGGGDGIVSVKSETLTKKIVHAYTILVIIMKVFSQINWFMKL